MTKKIYNILDKYNILGKVIQYTFIGHFYDVKSA